MKMKQFWYIYELLSYEFEIMYLDHIIIYMKSYNNSLQIERIIYIMH